jgi:hypothetical protein
MTILFCDFERIDVETIQCLLCGTKRKYAREPWRYSRVCQADPKMVLDSTGPCVYRGAVVEQTVCNTCGFKGRPLEIYACELHGKCMLKRYRNDRPDLKVCVSCRDFEAVGAASSA